MKKNAKFNQALILAIVPSLFNVAPQLVSILVKKPEPIPTPPVVVQNSITVHVNSRADTVYLYKFSKKVP
ncbi:hypothetical protein [Rufibacter sp. LB8]|uniref:hypothetical protein n=1 Tax=Rufibacter sp. LB8 TaxID=2777781 RepID=UPI00178C19CC|nr:hypothetical protein [Rufibacter sp. LB8]